MSDGNWSPEGQSPVFLSARLVPVGVREFVATLDDVDDCEREAALKRLEILAAR